MVELYFVIGRAWHANCHDWGINRFGPVIPEPCEQEIVLVLNLVIWLALGGFVGWIASVLLRTQTHKGRWLNAGVGGVGALMAGFWVAPLIAAPAAQDRLIDGDALAVASLGAVVLLVVVNAISRFSSDRQH